MKISLNELVQLTSAMVGKPFSIPLQNQLKTVYNYKRADWMQKILDKHPEQRKYFLKDLTVQLEEVSRSECPIITNCKVYKTVKKIPLPTRTKDTLFDYVGDPDKFDSYSYTTTEQLTWITKYSKYTGNRPRYFYVNNYVYIYNEPQLEYINIRGLWFDQKQLNEFKCNNQPCYTDDDQYEIADDIINTMVQDVIKNELRIMAPDIVTEVTVDKQQTPN